MGVEATWLLLGRPGCHLCDEMATLLDSVLPKFGQTYEVVCVDDIPVYRDRWGDVIPVLLRDGLPVAKIRTDPRSLERIIRRRR